jgi:type IV secretory pathway component VirB8
MPKSQLVSMSIFAAVVFFAFIISTITTISIFPLTKEQSFMVHRELDFDEGMTVKRIGKDDENATISYLKYLLGEYVQAREEYNPANIERNFNFVIELSDDKIFMDYLAVADQNKNPNHPVWQYGSRAIKEIFVTKTELAGIEPKLENYNQDTEYTAKINFISSLLFIDNLEQQEKMQADVKFKFEPIIIDQKTSEIKQLPKLVITDYKTMKLENL